jgi:hypothetical protein
VSSCASRGVQLWGWMVREGLGNGQRQARNGKGSGVSFGLPRAALPNLVTTKTACTCRPLAQWVVYLANRQDLTEHRGTQLLSDSNSCFAPLNCKQQLVTHTTQW